MFRKTVLAALCAVVAFGLLPVRSHAADPIRLTYSNFFPPTHVQSKLAEQWCREVEKRTHGAVEIQYFPGGTLTKAAQIYDGVVEGLSDIGMSAPAYSRGRFPVMAAVDLPLGYPSGAAATNVANAVYEKFKPQELDDVQVMYFHAHGPGLLFTKDNPVRNIMDLQGLKIRATGNSAKVVQALGATPVAQSMPDAYQSIQKGVVDGGMYPMETNKGWKMGEVVDYCTESYGIAYTTSFFVVMNKDKWASLPADAQKAIAETNKEWAVRHGQAWDASDVEGRKFFLAQGNTFVQLDPGQDKAWKAAMEPIIDEYIREADARNLPGKDIVSFTRAMLNTQ